MTDVAARRPPTVPVEAIERKAFPTGATNEQLADAIARLPEREKLVVTLYYYEELTMLEIAEALGISESQVSQLRTKAILRLRKWLGR